MLEDSNGNMATFGENGNTWTATDSLGRTAFSTTIPIDYAGQIPAGTYNVTTTGENNNPESYSVVFSQISLGSFTMPHPIGGPVGSAGTETVILGFCGFSYECPTNFGIIQETPGSTLPVLSSITLPDSTQYTFQYDPTYGTISKIGFPTGGYVRFVWGIRANGGGHGQFNLLSTLVVTDVYTSTGSGSENHWNYNFPSCATVCNQLTSTVYAPDGSYTAYTGVPLYYSGPPLSTMGAAPSWKEASRLEYSSSSTPMRSVATTYYTTGMPAQIATTLLDGPTPLQQVVQYLYDGYANVIEKDESDFNTCTSSCTPPAFPAAPSGGWLRSTYTNYLWSNPSAGQPPYNYTGAHIVDKPSQVLVTNGSGTPASLTIYTYDQPANIGFCPGANPGCAAGISTHDDKYFGSNAVPRGDLTTEARCITISGTGTSATCGTSVNTSYYYDLTGQLTEKIEGANTLPAPTINTWGGLNAGFLMSVMQPNGLTDSYTYFPPTGEVKTHTDWNNQTTTYDYTDPLNRMVSITLPATKDGTTGNMGSGNPNTNYSSTRYTYIDSSGGFTVQEQHAVDTAGTTTSVTKYYDGLGRLTTTISASPQCGIETDTTYDSMSRVASVSNPYCSYSDTTYGITQFFYDGLGRKIETMYPDFPANPLSFSTIAYAGNATETTDPPNGTTSVQHIQQVDGLGRLTNVCEVALSTQVGAAPSACGPYISGSGSPTTYINIPASGSLTSYTYDPLGNMTSVNQHGLARSFTYDGLSRLTYALNPEVGTDVYTYPSSSTPCAPSAAVPCTRTDARGVVTSYAYDSMSRLTSKSYSTSDLTSCYQYNTAITNYPDSNPKGQLTAEWQQAGSCPTVAQSSIPSSAVGARIRSNHDAMGRVGLDSQCLTGTSCSATTGNFVYTYNLLGNPVQANNGIAPPTAVSATQTANTNGNGTLMTAPSITWQTTYDMADHINNVVVQDQPSTSVFPTNTYSFGPTLLQPTNYDPFGHMTAGLLGISNATAPTGAVTISRQYNNRSWIMRETDDGDAVSASASGSMGVISLSGAEAGPLTAPASSGTGVLTVSGSDGGHLVCTIMRNQYTSWQTCNYVSDTGTLQVTINGFTASAYYGSGSSDSTVAAQLTAGLNGSGSPVTATQNGSSITVTAIATGTASNYPISISNGDFSVSDPNSTLTGGHAAGPVYDAGTATVTITGGSPAVNFTTSAVFWGQGDTPSTLATHLASAINSAAGSVVTASASGGSVNLASTVTGDGTDYTVSVSITDTQTATYPSLFPSPSFSASGGNMSGGATAGSNYGTIYSYNIQPSGYAPNGNILQHTDSVMGTWNFHYDAVDRLTTATQTAVSPTVAASQNYAGSYACWAWSYDSYGNRTLEAFSSVPCTGSNLVPQVQAFYGTVNTNNRIQSISGNNLATFSYDASGNTLYDGNNEYWYDAEGQLCAVQSQRYTGAAVIQYIYDAEGARIGKGTLASAPSSYTATCAPPLASGFTLTEWYLVDLGGDQVTELSEQGLPTPQTEKWQHSNVWAGGKLTATYDYNYGHGGIHFELADPLGTKRVQANALGQIDEQCTSLPFGNDINNPPNLAGTSCTFVANLLSTADDATEHHFTGKERDSESGNDYFEARYYSSAMGRFMSPDWSAKAEPVPYSRLDDPQTLNLYSYVANNPLVRADLDGHDGILLNNSSGAYGYGHNAVLVGNDKHDGQGTGWVYFSKNGTSGNTQHWYATFADFQKSTDAKQYDRGFRVSTSEKQDQKMINTGVDNINKDYSVKEKPNVDPNTGKETGGNKAENCADLSATVLGAGDIKIDKPKEWNAAVGGSFTAPNDQYNAVVNNNKNGQVVKPCVGSDCKK
jgi:RHS repeat-associated protein